MTTKINNIYLIKSIDIYLLDDTPIIKVCKRRNKLINSKQNQFFKKYQTMLRLLNDCNTVHRASKLNDALLDKVETIKDKLNARNTTFLVFCIKNNISFNQDTNINKHTKLSEFNANNSAIQSISKDVQIAYELRKFVMREAKKSEEK
jgi:hypothetical protein